MNQEIKTIVKKTAKIAGVTCIAAGAVALMTSATALKALTEGGKYLKDTVKKIVGDKPEVEEAVDEAAAEEVAEPPVEEPAAEVAEVIETGYPDVTVSEDQA